MNIPKIDPEIIRKMNDLGTYGPAPIHNAINQINELNEMKRQREYERDEAIKDTAEHTARTAEAVEDIEQRVTALKSDLEKEHEAREAADADMMNYTKSYNSSMKKLAAWAIAVAVLSLFVAVATVLFSIGIIELPNADKNSDGYSDGSQSQQDADSSQD